jgi:DNA-binding MarR family transcriptional regulator
MNSLEKLGLVEAEFVKAGRGRPPKVFRLTEKGRQVADNIPEKILQEAWRVAVGQDFSSKDFSHNNNSALPSFKEVVGKDGQFKGDLINLTKGFVLRSIRAVGGSQISFENLERKAPGEGEAGRAGKESLPESGAFLPGLSPPLWREVFA